MQTIDLRLCSLVLALMVASGCGESTPDAGSDSSTSTRASAITGHEYLDAPDSRASEVRSAFGIAGTVVVVHEVDSDVACTGTLIGWDRVVTSSECFDGFPDLGSAAGRLKVTVPQGEASTREFGVEVAASLQADGIAIIKLSSKVPMKLSGHVAPVFTDNIQEAFASGRLDPEKAYIAGMGECAAGPSPCSLPEGKLRRIGPINVPVSVGDYNGEKLLEATLDTSVGAIIDGVGDLGAPLFMFDSQAQRFALVGVLRKLGGSGVPYWWQFFGQAEDPTSPLVDKWVALRKYWIDGPPNGRYVVRDPNRPSDTAEPALGSDLDEDRVLDDSDNCPPSLCEHLVGVPRPELFCGNFQQVDSDGDGVGDSCTWICSNPNNLGTNSNVEAENDFWTPTPTPWLNSEARIDACDPVPILRLDTTQMVGATGLERQSGTGSRTVEALTFSVNPYLGLGSYEDRVTEPIAFRFCDCYKLASDGTQRTMTEVECRSRLGAGRCFASEANWALDESNWVKVDVLSLASDPPVSVSGVTGGAPQTFIRHSGNPLLEEPPTEWKLPHQGQPKFRWNWFKEIQQGRIRSERHPQGRGVRVTRGFLASAVVGEEWRSQRDQTTRGNIRAVVDYVELPRFEKAGEVTEGSRGRNPCGVEGYFDDWVYVDISGPLCVFWENPKSRYLDLIPDLREWVRGPRVLDKIADGRIGLHLEGRAFQDASTFIGRGVSKALDLKADRVIVPAAESRSSLETAGKRAVAAALPRSDISLKDYLVDSTALGLAFRGEPIGLQGAMSSELESQEDLDAADLDALGVGAMAAAPSFMPRVPAFAAATFSSVEEVVFVAGGTGPGDLGTIRRFDMGGRTSSTLTPSKFAPGPQVLSITYDSHAKMLYLLDLVREGNETSARVVRHPAEGGEPALLWKVPFSGLYTTYSLNVSQEGWVVFLTVGGDSTFRSWRMNGNNGAFIDSLEGEGSLYLPPVMGPNHLEVAIVESDGSLRYETLHPKNYLPGEPCAAL